MATSIVRCQNLAKTYPLGKGEVMALKDFSYNFGSGFTLVVGPSGSGKSTLLNLIGGLDQPSSGQLYINDRDITTLSERKLSVFRRQNIGFIFQSFSLIGTLNVYDNVEYPLLTNRDISANERRSRVKEMLAGVGLADFDKRFPRALSGGQQQRVAIARSLINHPLLVLADEPTASLDSHTSDLIFKLLERMAAEHQTSIILASHDYHVIKRVAKALHLLDGQLNDEGDN